MIRSLIEGSFSHLAVEDCSNSIRHMVLAVLQLCHADYDKTTSCTLPRAAPSAETVCTTDIRPEERQPSFWGDGTLSRVMAHYPTDLFQAAKATPAEDMATLRDRHGASAALSCTSRLQTQRTLPFGQLLSFVREVRVLRIVRRIGAEQERLFRVWWRVEIRRGRQERLQWQAGLCTRTALPGSLARGVAPRQEAVQQRQGREDSERLVRRRPFFWWSRWKARHLQQSDNIPKPVEQHMHVLRRSSSKHHAHMISRSDACRPQSTARRAKTPSCAIRAYSDPMARQ